jgi:cytoskeletal protein RodZ
MPRLFAVGLWLVATLISTAIVWTATSTVAADVTDRPAPVVPRRDVVSQLATVPTTTTTTPTTTRPAPTSTTRVVRTTIARNSPTTAPAPATTRPAPATTVPAPPPVTAPPTTQAPSGPTATYPTAGGVVRVRCDGILIHLVSATPADGWSVLVVTGGPLTVEVHFLRLGQIATVKAVCFGQPIRYFGDVPRP